MNLCPKCQMAVWDTLERKISAIPGFTFTDDDAYLLLTCFGISLQDFESAMASRGWYRCDGLWSQEVNEDRLCLEYAKGDH